MRIVLLVSVLALSACVKPPLDDYRPVVDNQGRSNVKYERDLAECVAIGKQSEKEYTKKQEQQMGANVVGGIIVGALLGAALGNSDWAAVGAAQGAAAGVAATDTELANGGPRRIIDRCMGGRGHKVLNDLGKG